MADFMIKMQQQKEVSNANLLPELSVSSQETLLVKPGYWVYIKAIKRKNWASPREKPFRTTQLDSPVSLQVTEGIGSIRHETGVGCGKSDYKRGFAV